MDGVEVVPYPTQQSTIHCLYLYDAAEALRIVIIMTIYIATTVGSSSSSSSSSQLRRRELQLDGDGGIGEEMVMEFGSVEANDDDSPATSAAIPSISNNDGTDLGKDTILSWQ